MPVAKGGPPPLRQALLVGLGIVMTFGTVLFLVTQTDQLMGGSSPVGIGTGDQLFQPGPAKSLAELIAANDRPTAFADPTGGDRDIWLNHLGPEVDEGWVAFGARPLTSPRACVTEWQEDERHFVDSCDGTIYPPDGEGLPQYLVTVDENGFLTIRFDSVTTGAADETGTADTTDAGDEPEEG